MKDFKPLNLVDLEPKKMHFMISGKPGVDLVLTHWSLRVRNWATEKYGDTTLKEIFENLRIQPIADIAWFMLMDREKHFPLGQDEFLDAIITPKDQLTIIKALLGSVGIGEPEMKKLEAAVEKKEAAKLGDPKSKPRPPKSTG